MAGKSSHFPFGVHRWSILTNARRVARVLTGSHTFLVDYLRGKRENEREAPIEKHTIDRIVHPRDAPSPVLDARPAPIRPLRVLV